MSKDYGKYNTTITIISPVGHDYNWYDAIEKCFGKNLKVISQEDDCIDLTWNDNSHILLRIDDIEDTRKQIMGMTKFYSKVELKNKTVKDNVLMQLQLSNCILYFHYNVKMHDGKQDATSMNATYCLFNLAKITNSLLMQNNLQIFQWNGKLLMSPTGQSEVEQFTPTIIVEVPNQKEKEFSEEDKERIYKNIEILKTKNIPYNENMKFIPNKSNTELASPIIVYARLMIDYVEATMAATFPNDVDIEIWDQIYNSLNAMYLVDAFFEEEEKDKQILKSLKENNYANKDELTWHYEKCAIFLWVLKLWDFPRQDSECDVEKMNSILAANMNNPYNMPDYYLKLLDEDKNFDINKVEMRSYEEILEKADLLKRYKWAIDEANINHQPFNYPLSPLIVQYQLDALADVLLWDLNTPIH